MSDLNDQLSDAMFCQCWKTSRAENISVRSKSCFDPCVCCTASFITVNDAKSFTQPFIQVTPVKTFHKSRHLADSCLQITTKDKQPENSLSLFFVENFVSVVNKNCLATTRRTHNRPALTRRSPRLTLIRSLASHDAAAHSLCNGFALAPMLTDHVLKQVNQMHEMNKGRKAT